MTNEHDTAGVQPDNSHREQINQPTRPIEPGQDAAGAGGGKRQFVPGPQPLPPSGFTDDTQTFPQTTSTPQSDTSPILPVGQRGNPSPTPVVTRPYPGLTRPLPGGTTVQALLAPTGAPQAGAPPSASSGGVPKRAGRRDYRLFALAGGLVLIILLSFAFVSISSSFLPHTQNTPDENQATVVSGTGVPIADGFSVAPARFSPVTCAVDNGYRCTAMLFYGKIAPGLLNWTAYGTNVATKFSPASGVLAPGQQQQVIIYMLTPCPNNGNFVFQINGTDTKLLVPWSCE